MARAEAGVAIVRRHPEASDAWPGMFSTWHVANGKRAKGDADAAIVIFTECAEMARRCGLRVGEACQLAPPNHNRLLKRHPHLRNALKLLGRKVELRPRATRYEPPIA